MPVRGEAAGIAERVARVEEDVRNLRRLPGAVVPALVAAPVTPPATVVASSLPATLVAKVYAEAVAETEAPFSTIPMQWDASGFDSVGENPPTIWDDSSNETLLLAPGAYIAVARVRAAPVDDIAILDETRWTVSLALMGSAGEVVMYRPPPGAVTPGGEIVTASVMWHVSQYEFNNTVTADLYAHAPEGIVVQLWVTLTRLGDTRPDIYSGYGP